MVGGSSLGPGQSLASGSCVIKMDFQSPEGERMKVTPTSKKNPLLSKGVPAEMCLTASFEDLKTHYDFPAKESS